MYSSQPKRLGFTVTDVAGLGPVAIPQTQTELGEFLGLQRALNAFIAKHSILGAKPVAVDGRLGPSTRTMFNLVSGFISGMQPAPSITSLATYAEDYGRTLAVAAGVTYDASTPTQQDSLLVIDEPMVLDPHTSSLPSVSPPKPKTTVLGWVLAALALMGVAAGAVVYVRKRRIA